MKISELIKGSNIGLTGDGNKEIAGITYDSRKASKDFLFVALHGANVDGKKYIKDAISHGASAILTDDKTVIDNNTAYLYTDNITEMLGKLSSRFYGDPSEKMKVFSVTGTNGKTTITYLIEQLRLRVGRKQFLRH